MEHDVIYLQHGESPIRLEEAGITWCQDKINEGDTKYLLATPEREAVPELLEVLKDSLYCMYLLTRKDVAQATKDNAYKTANEKGRAAIARAAPPDVSDELE